MAASLTHTGDVGLTGATALAVPSVSMNEWQDVACVSGNPALDSFNRWIGWALEDLRDAPCADEAPRTRAICLKGIASYLRHALTAANWLRCSARKAMCLRVLNWINADIRRIG